MFTAVGYQVLIRGFRLALSVEGLKPHTIENYEREAERFAAAYEGQDPQPVTIGTLARRRWWARQGFGEYPWARRRYKQPNGTSGAGMSPRGCCGGARRGH